MQCHDCVTALFQARQLLEAEYENLVQMGTNRMVDGRGMGGLAGSLSMSSDDGGGGGGGGGGLIGGSSTPAREGGPPPLPPGKPQQVPI